MDNGKIAYKNCWLTLNHACNLNCKWCYAKDTGYLKSDDMSLDMAYDIIDICHDLSINHITLIGGEPTIYPHLFDVIDYAQKWNIRCGIVSNGIRYADERFVKKLVGRGIKSVSISLKGENETSFYSTTGVNAFGVICNAVKVLRKCGMRVSVSMVLSEENIETFLEGIKTMKELGVDRFHLSFCYEFDIFQKNAISLNPYKVINLFVKNYSKLDAITGGEFELFQPFPLCIWDPNFINMMAKKRQISTVCQLLQRSGLIFDPNGTLIPCNSMYSVKLGKLYKDFCSSEDLIRYVNQDSIKQIYDQLCSVPDDVCLSCDKYENCGGGCVCQWTKYSFQELMNMKDVNNG